MTTQLEEVARIWPEIQHVFTVPRTEAEYNRLVGLLDDLIDEVGEDESHPLASLMETLGSLVESYETMHIPEPQGDPVETLQMLMEEHHLTQKDLSDIGSQGVVSEILSRKRKLNLRQIEALSQRFHVSPDVFI